MLSCYPFMLTVTVATHLRKLSLACLLAAGLFVGAPAWAQPDAGAGDALDVGPLLTPPSLKTHGEAAYPARALEQRIEGNVGLELDLDDAGQVVGVRVIEPAGHGFDEAAGTFTNGRLPPAARTSPRSSTRTAPRCSSRWPGP